MRRESKVIFINQDSGYLMIDIINAFSDAGRSCVLITGRLVERNIHLKEDISVRKIIRYNRINIFNRFFTWIIGFLQIWALVLFEYRKDELFVVSNPPFAPLLSILSKLNIRLLIFDIYPDVLSELGYLSKNSFLIKTWERLNRKAYNNATKIYTLTDGMKKVLTKYSRSDIIEVVPIWTDNSFLKPVKRSDNPFVNKHNLLDKFIVMYSGNIGLTNNIEVLIDIAERISNDRIQFLIIGSGASKYIIEQKIEKLNLKNVLLLPWQEPAQIPYSFSAADLAVIIQGSRVSKLAIPSKFYNFLSVGAPLLTISSVDSELSGLVSNYSCGKNFEITQLTEIANFINELANSKNLQNKFKICSIEASKDFGRENLLIFDFLTGVS